MFRTNFTKIKNFIIANGGHIKEQTFTSLKGNIQGQPIEIIARSGLTGITIKDYLSVFGGKDRTKPFRDIGKSQDDIVGELKQELDYFRKCDK
jgi:hypothetical protein